MTHRFPRSMLRAVAPADPGQLQRLDQGPQDDRLQGLHGHWFSVSPGGYTPGTFNPSTEKGQPPGPCIAGDGHVHRVDLSPGKLTFDSRRVAALSQAAEVEAKKNTRIADFSDLGVSRISPSNGFGRGGFGVRNFSNTALVPVSIPIDGDERTAPALVVTYDAGRPWLMDPRTFEMIAPIGSMHTWSAQLFRRCPFPFLNSTAHPAWAVEEGGAGTLYVVDFVRDLGAKLLRILDLLKKECPPDGPEDGRLDGDMTAADYQDLTQTVVGEVLLAKEPGLRIGIWRAPDGAGAAKDALRFVPVVGPTGDAIVLEDSCHQMVVTDTYVVFADAAFKFELDSLIPEATGFATLSLSQIAWLRKRLSFVPKAKTPLWAVRRADLDAALENPDQAPVRAIALGTFDDRVIHFAADRNDEGGTCVRILAVHHNATDPGEFVHSSDTDLEGQPFWDPNARGAPGGSDRHDVIGFFTAGYDPNEVASYAFHVDAQGRATKTRDDESGQPEDWRAAAWMLGLPTGPNMLTGTERPGDAVDRIFLGSLGLPPELVTRLTYDLYQSYGGRFGPNRGLARTSVEELNRIIKDGGRSGAFLAARRENGKLVLDDWFETDPGVVTAAPQFIPAPEGSAGDGLVCVAVFREFIEDGDQRRREIWVFDAGPGKLSEGPLARFDAEPLGWRMPFHAAWLPDLGPEDASWPGWVVPKERVPVGARDAAWSWFKKQTGA